MQADTPLTLDDGVRYGIRVNGLSRASALDEIRRTEACGYDSLWVTDHLAFHVPITDAMGLLAFAAGVTERIMLGSAVYLLPLRPTIATAKATASIDMLSGGRLTLGIGVGGEYPPEWEAAGVDRHTRGARTDEAIPLLRRLWSEKGVAHEGRHERFSELSVAPQPVRAGGPPIWVGGRSDAAMRRAGRLGDGYISHMATPEHYARNLERIAEAAHEAGRAPLPFSTAAYFFTWIGDDEEEAAAACAEELGRVYAMPFDGLVRKYCLVGTPDSIRARLQQYVDAGLRHAIIAPLRDEAATIERFADEVRPHVHVSSA